MTLVRRRCLLAVIGVAVSIVALAPAAASQPSEGFLFSYPAWSHDGKRIALVGLLGYDDSYLFVMNADGSNLHKIDTTGIDQRPNSADRVNSPSWSPDDKRIAFSAGGYINSLWRIGSDGRGLIRLVRNAYGPAWSPGGRRIAYYSHVSDSEIGTIIEVIRPDGTDERVVAIPDHPNSQSYSDPTWSPDGERLAFAWHSPVHDSRSGFRTVPFAPDRNPVDSGIGIISDYGAQPKVLLPGHVVYGLAWSPSGREIAFVYEGVVWLLNLRTGNTTSLRPGSSPSWSPNGKKIVFADAGVGGSIYVMNRDGSHARLLLPGS